MTKISAWEWIVSIDLTVVSAIIAWENEGRGYVFLISALFYMAGLSWLSTIFLRKKGVI